MKEKHVMDYKCCKTCGRRPEDPTQACEFGWHVFGSSKDRSICIFARAKSKSKDEAKSQVQPQKVYIAGTFSTEESRKSLLEMIAIVKKAHPEFNLYVPMEFKVKDDYQKPDGTWHLSNEVWAKKVFDNDIKELSKSTMVIAMYSGHLSTTGTSWEIGYAYAKGLPIIAYIPECAKNQNMSLMIMNSLDGYMNDDGDIIMNTNELLNKYNQK